MHHNPDRRKELFNVLAAFVFCFLLVFSALLLQSARRL